MNKKVISMVLATTMLLGACGKSEEKKENGTKDTAIKIGMVTDTNGVDDKSFNQSAWEGIKKIGEHNGLTEGKDYRYIQSMSEAEFIPNLTKFGEANFDITFGIGYLLESAMENVAAQFPTNNFAIVDAVAKGDNIASITFKENEGSFLAGVVAGLATKTDKVGFVGGIKTELIEKFEYGFRAGVEAVNPKAQVIVEYAQAFDKPERGAQIASAMYSQQADIIYQAAGGSGNGVFTEAKNRAKKGEKVWVIGVDRDQHQEGMPENVTLTSMVKDVGLAVDNVVQQTMDGKFPGGEVVSLGIKENGVSLSSNEENIKSIDPTILEKVNEYKEKIINGEIKVPSTLAEYKNR
ncbi:MAG: BMP family protein [Bacillaceae bacterium]